MQGVSNETSQAIIVQWVTQFLGYFSSSFLKILVFTKNLIHSIVNWKTVAAISFHK